MKRKYLIGSPEVARLAHEMDCHIPYAVGVIECLNHISALYDMKDIDPDALRVMLGVRKSDFGPRTVVDVLTRAGVLDDEGNLTVLVEGEYSD